jgi:hypothetical protein
MDRHGDSTGFQVLYGEIMKSGDNLPVTEEILNLVGVENALLNAIGRYCRVVGERKVKVQVAVAHGRAFTEDERGAIQSRLPAGVYISSDDLVSCGVRHLTLEVGAEPSTKTTSWSTP